MSSLSARAIRPSMPQLPLGAWVRSTSPSSTAEPRTIYRRSASSMSTPNRRASYSSGLAQPIAIHTDPATGRIVSLECERDGSKFQIAV